MESSALPLSVNTQEVPRFINAGNDTIDTLYMLVNFVIAFVSIVTDKLAFPQDIFASKFETEGFF